MAATRWIRTVRRMTDRPVPVTILELSSAHVAARALHVVAELGVADHVGDAGSTAEELAAALGVDGRALSRLLRLLEAHGLFRAGAGRRWHHTEASLWLRSDHPTSLRAFARMSGLPFSWGSFGALEQAVRSGGAGIFEVDPGGLWSYLRSHPDESVVFQEAMIAKAHDDVAALLAAYDFSPFERIVDVAGGQGQLVTAVLGAYPQAAGVLFELPEVAAEVPAVAGLEVVAGDFFTDAVPAGDAHVLMNIIHDWDDDAAVRILANVAAAGRKTNATVLIVETVMPDGSEPHWAKTLDVMMLALTGGLERTRGEYEALLGAAGLRLQRVVPTATPFSVLEAVAA